MTQNQISNASPDRLPRLLTAREVAEILAISQSYVYKLIRDRTIPSIPIGRSVRVRERALMEFIDERAQSN